MLRPEQMSKVSVTGAKSVMDEVIETMHEMHIVHITDYDGSWTGFEPGTPLEGSEETSSTLVTVRSLKSILDIDADEVGSTETVDLSNAGERLEEIRTEVNDLDDRREELEDQLREIEERLDRMELFADLGIDLDLLWGYDSLDVLVGEGDADEIESALAKSADVEAFDVFSGEETVAAFGYMAEDATLSDELVGVPFTAHEVPEEEGSPEAVVEDLTSQQNEIEAKLETVESELDAVRADAGAFLLALEEDRTVDVQKFEAPLKFATTERSFVVEGWVPADEYEQFADDLQRAVEGHVEIDELERAAYTSGGHLGHDDAHDAQHQEEAATDGGVAAGTAAPTDDQEVATDGGTSDGVVTVDDDPPVRQENPGIITPFELLTKAVNRPKYSEFDPTFLLFLTFPLFFGFVIGDIGYGLAYVAIGYYVRRRFDAPGLRDFGTVVAWLGIFTVGFGVLYGEVFGLHFFEWVGSEAVIHKGLSDTAWAKAWLVVAVIVGWLHLNIGYVLDFVEELQLHGAKAAVVEVGSWLVMLNGLWVFIFSTAFDGSKPAFLVGPEASLNTGPLGVGFAGFPELVGIAGGIAFFVGLGILITGPWYEAFEFAVPLAHTLSYTRLTAVLLAKAGMALAANLLYWGVYTDEEGFHYIHESTPGKKADAGKEIVFGGLANMGSQVDIGPLTVGITGALVGLPVLLVAHVIVLAVGGTAAIQAIRLEYFEFFEKFYEGGGKNYEPFGYDRTYTTDT
jgi:V/A-type H+-transporting ATPase subunit I